MIPSKSHLIYRWRFSIFNPVRCYHRLKNWYRRLVWLEKEYDQMARRLATLEGERFGLNRLEDPWTILALPYYDQGDLEEALERLHETWLDDPCQIVEIQRLEATFNWLLDTLNEMEHSRQLHLEVKSE